MPESWNAAANRPVIATPIKTFMCPRPPGGEDRVCARVRERTAAADRLRPRTTAPRPLVTAGYIDRRGADDNGVLEVNRCYSVAGDPRRGSNTFAALRGRRAGPTAGRRGKMTVAQRPDRRRLGRPRQRVHHPRLRPPTARPRPVPHQLHQQQRGLQLPPGGANHVFADGSVRFVKASMDIRLFVKLITRAGGDIIPWTTNAERASMRPMMVLLRRGPPGRAVLVEESGRMPVAAQRLPGR